MRTPEGWTPDFLVLPHHSAKPRSQGITAVIDGGLPVAAMTAILDTGSAFCDVWKLGWGTAYLDPRLADKLTVLRRNLVSACPGGTLLEVAARQGRAEACLDWFAEVGFGWVEISNGMRALSRRAKRELIMRASRDFTVVAEVGAKDPAVTLDVGAWVRTVLEDLDAGAERVITEGRESGTVGIFSPDGTVRVALVDALVSAVGADRLVFEAPRKEQQAWFIRHLGPDVNLANVAPSEIMGVEALRLGLRADTVEMDVPFVATEAPVATEVGVAGEVGVADDGGVATDGGVAAEVGLAADGRMVGRGPSLRRWTT